MAVPLNALTSLGDGTVSGPPQNVLLGPPTQPLAPPPTQADAWDANSQAYSGWLAQQRASGVASGMIDPDSGWPTQNALLDAAHQWGSAMIAGTGAPGEGFTAFHGSPHSFDQFQSSAIGTGDGTQAFGHGLYFAGNEKVAQSYRDNLSKIDLNAPLGEHGNSNPGHMYEVAINADPAHFLDWDKPLSQQSPHVQQALAGLGVPHPGDPTGVQILQNVHHSQYDANGPIGQVQRPEELLQQAGIAGIRYLDGGSRANGEGTSNHVIFDPATIEILRKYGIAGLIAGGAAAATQGQPGPTQ
jgi:hypothetical protein